jgi:hypothetical protein
MIKLEDVMNFCIKVIARLVLFAAILACVFAFARVGQHLSGGFRVDKIKTTMLEDKSYGNSAVDEDILAILDQPFTYIDKGSQTYVFESEDKNYVIKFIRFNRYRQPFWMSYLNKTDAQKKYVAGRIVHKHKSFTSSLTSYNIAEKYLQDNTGIIYSHLAQSDNINKKMRVKDKVGRKMVVDLDTTGFILQKKAIPLTSFLLNIKQKDDDIALREIIISFLRMICSLYEKNIVIRDYNCVKNAGVLDGCVINIDLGSFFAKDNLEDKQEFTREIRNFTKHFVKWSNRNNFPLALLIFEEELNKIITKKYEGNKDL